MKKVYIFNPQNDLALEKGGINYVAPPFAMQIAHDLAVLPAFIAEPGSLLITDSDADAEWLEHLNATFGLDVHAVRRAELRRFTDYRIMPWGWCLDLRRRLIKWGANSDNLPCKDEIDHLRGLSHRRVSALIHLRLKELLGKQLCPAPVELALDDDVLDFVRQHRNCFIKTPWSSSGRGIYHTIDGASPEFAQWCRGALKRQGSLLCEQALDKKMDLAVEFYCEKGKTSVRGYSLFETDSHSQYDHGVVTAKNELKSRITASYPEFDEVVAALNQVLDEMVAPHYEGWLGIDMLLYNTQCTNFETNGVRPQSSHFSIGINPCVELNLRPTMGAITSVIGEKLISPGKTATFRIEQRSGAEWAQKNEPVIENHRLCSGTMCLTTPSDTALYRATLSVDE
ncbi:MAG: hypothetical protein IKW83_00020 [Muribaculaceae bacterium]|nr:hypothetical protein [Muribaculaceae bacterium]